MLTLRWHRFRLRFGPFLWRRIRSRPLLLERIARVSSRLRPGARSGRLKGDEEARSRLEALLEPLDIIVERGRPKLSDDLIPGYFTHAAVHLGRELAGEVLEAAGAGPAARAGDLALIEATHAGVRLVSLAEFLDVDSLAVLRPDPASGGGRRRFAERAAREIGKEYDYRFDLGDHGKQYCCKLISSLFPALPFADLVGVGAALVPDDFARPALTARPGSPRLVHLIHDGLAVPAERRDEAFALLLHDGCRPRGPAPAREGGIPWQRCRTC